MNLNKVKEALKGVLQQFAQVSTDKGVVIWANGKDFPEVGDAVYTIDEENHQQQLADGDYECDVATITIKEGKIENIVEKEKTDETKTETVEDPDQDKFSNMCKEKFESYEEKERKIVEAIRETGVIDCWLVEAGDDYGVVEIWGENGYKYMRYDVAFDGENAVVSNPVEVKSAFVPVESAPVEPQPEEEGFSAATTADTATTETATTAASGATDATTADTVSASTEEEKKEEEPKKEEEMEEDEVAKLVERIAALEARIDALEKKPAAQTAEEEFKRIETSFKSTGDKKIDNLRRILNAK